MVYLPENLFYNTPAPGILLFLNENKAKDRQGRLFLVNASQVFEKGTPKNFISDPGIERIATAFKEWKEEDKFAKVVTREQVAKEDYNTSRPAASTSPRPRRTGPSPRSWRSWKPSTLKRRRRTRRCGES